MNPRSAAAQKLRLFAIASILSILLSCSEWPVFAQAKKGTSAKKPSLDLLLSRVDSYWKLLLERKKIQAAKFVLESEREVFADRTIPNFTDPRLKSLEFTSNEDEVKVTVVVKRNLNFGIMDWPVAELWQVHNNNWYLKPYPPGIPGTAAERKALRIEQEETQKIELRKILRFEKSVIDFGMVQRGTPVTLTLKYALDGSDTVPVLIEKSSTLIKIDGFGARGLLP